MKSPHGSAQLFSMASRGWAANIDVSGSGVTSHEPAVVDHRQPGHRPGRHELSRAHARAAAHTTFEPPPGVPRSNTIHVTIACPSTMPARSPTACRSTPTASPWSTIAAPCATSSTTSEVRRVYYPEVERVVKQATGAYRVRIFDHTPRRSRRARRTAATRRASRCSACTSTTRALEARSACATFCPTKADELPKGRVQVINLWRPIKGPVQDSPLAVCDATTIDLADPGAVGPASIQHRVGETYSVKCNPAHRWFYVPQMRVDEGAAAEVLGHQDRRAGALHAAQCLRRSDGVSRCSAAREHRGEDAGVSQDGSACGRRGQQHQ